MTTERLYCRCGREVGLVRLNPDTLAFGHRTNPGPASHRVRLARSAAGYEDAQRLSEGPAVSPASGWAGPSPDPALASTETGLWESTPVREPRRARRVQAGSPIHGRNVEPEALLSGSVPAASGSRST